MTRSLKRVARALLKLTSYEVVRREVVTKRAEAEYDFEGEARAAIQRVRSHTMVSEPALITLYQQVVYCERHSLSGAFVECGTWKGGAVGLMALANLCHGAARRSLHLFDSFRGAPEPISTIDGEKAVAEAGGRSRAQGRLEVALDYGSRGGPGSVEGSKALMEALGYDVGRVHCHAGWFQETVPRDAAAIGPIAILRLDGDWYESTKVCLENLYPYVVPGGFIIVDDYGCYEGCRKATDEFISRLRPVPFLHHVNRDVRHWQKFA